MPIVLANKKVVLLSSNRMANGIKNIFTILRNRKWNSIEDQSECIIVCRLIKITNRIQAVCSSLMQKNGVWKLVAFPARYSTASNYVCVELMRRYEISTDRRRLLCILWFMHYERRIVFERWIHEFTLHAYWWQSICVYRNTSPYYWKKHINLVLYCRYFVHQHP